jgi:serine/threonine-protein kinase RsbW
VRTWVRVAVPFEQPSDGLRVSLSLQLPRDALSVPLARHIVLAAMVEVGVEDEDADAVQLALSEACANVVSHAGPGDDYEVTTTIGPSTCEIRVVDSGRGFDHASLNDEMAQLGAEHGRGLALMNAVVDAAHFVSEPERGTIVHLVKELHLDDGAPARRLLPEQASR